MSSSTCQCGCGEAVRSGSRFRRGHNKRNQPLQSKCSVVGCPHPRLRYQAVCREHHNLKINTYRRKRMGLSPADYQAMLDEQGGVCAICGDPPGVQALAVDHDHATGYVRGLLCTNCNHLLGKAKDNRTVLEAAIAYLARGRS